MKNVGHDGERTVYVQGDDALELLKNGYCERCVERLSEHYEDRYGNTEVYGEFKNGDLVGFLCPNCASNRK